MLLRPKSLSLSQKLLGGLLAISLAFTATGTIAAFVMFRDRVEDMRVADGTSLSIIDKIPHLGHFGVAANPPAQSDVIVLNIGGDRGNSVAIACGHQTYRLKNLNPGEVALYDQWGNTVVLTQAGMTLTHATKITLSAPTIEFDANDVRLGAAGGPAVARVGDVVSGGTIASGSTKVTSA